MTTKKEERIFTTGTVSVVFVDTIKMARLSSSDTPPQTEHYVLDKVPRRGVNFRFPTANDATPEVATVERLLLIGLLPSRT